MYDLKELRKQIDDVDANLISVLLKRFEITAKIGEYKAENGKELFCADREDEKTSCIRNLLSEYADMPYIVDMFRCVMDFSKYQQSANIYGTKDIYLIGMPGCGKTTIGKLLADKMQREFIDLDVLFGQVYNITPAEIIEKQGEAEFRDKESELLKNVAEKTFEKKKWDTKRGRIISCGGGIVCRTENRDILKGDSVVIYIKRSLENLAVNGRPLSAQNGIEALFEQRKDKYESWCDMEIENNSSPEECVSEILKNIMIINRK